MDYKEPKTRQETKGKKGKEGKGVYNQKAIRIQEILREKKNDNDKSSDNNNDKKKDKKQQIRNNK